MGSWVMVPVFLIASGIGSGISSESTSFFLDSQRNEIACASYCYAVAKPLLQMAPLCHSKDQEISQLKDRLLQLEKKVSAYEVKESDCKVTEELSLLRNVVESMRNPADKTDLGLIIASSDNNATQLNECKACLVERNVQYSVYNQSIRGYQRRLAEARDVLSKCQATVPNTTKSDGEKALVEREYPEDCLDVKVPSNIRKIQVEGIEPFRVLCNGATAGPGWMVIQQRVNGLIDFERNWATYRSGFGDLHGSFFIGLEKLYRITYLKRHELYIELGNFYGRFIHAHYDSFRVDSEAEGYRLIDLGNYTGGAGDAGDALYFNNNQKFSTIDKDNDSSQDVHCAREYSSAWWHNNCTKSNLNGIYYSEPRQTQSGIWWSPWMQRYTFKSVQMLIRPKQ